MTDLAPGRLFKKLTCSTGGPLGNQMADSKFLKMHRRVQAYFGTGIPVWAPEL